jgi:hypothetical protein
LGDSRRGNITSVIIPGSNVVFASGQEAMLLAELVPNVEKHHLPMLRQYNGGLSAWEALESMHMHGVEDQGRLSCAESLTSSEGKR